MKTLRADARAQAECRLEETRQSVRQRALFTRAEVVEAIERGSDDHSDHIDGTSRMARGLRLHRQRLVSCDLCVSGRKSN